MDIFNRTPAIAEDTLQYTLHPGPPFPDESAVITLATLIDSYVSSVLPNHIWHRDAFELKVISSPYIPGNWSIEGRVRVGDCVDDEWCIVWLLRDITRRWDIAVNVFDSDGDFLLIEAAEHLPPWIKPTNAENRVWIYSGRLHLVPLQYISSSAPKRERRTLGGAGSDGDEGEQNSSPEYISMGDAVNVVRNAREDTLAAPNVERAAFRRVESYPDAARQHVHRTKAFVPSDIALALSNCPSLIQKATEAFYTRDAFQMRAANRMARFPPDSSILATVIMTRTAYAQLMGQKFHPPKIFGQWKEKEGTSEWRWRDIGMKIACGFEMIYQETRSRHEISMDEADGRDASLEVCKESLRRDPEYVRYIKNLSDVGFFKHEFEGSSLWKNQEDRAAARFMQARQIDDANRPSFASLVNSAISQARIQGGNEGPSPFLGGEEDSDEWLLVDESMVDNMLAHAQITVGAQGQVDMDVENEDSTETLEEKQAAEHASQLRQLAEKVGNFVEGRGDIEGAIFEDDVLSDEADMSELSDSDENTSDSHVHDTAERRAAMDKMVPALDPSEYGRMPPSFHGNSQSIKRSTVGTESSLIEDVPKQDASLSPKPIRPLIFPRDEFDGVEDSDDESEDEVIGGEEDEEDEEDRPQVVGELEVDMQEEAEEFLKFSREALGISSEMWNDIIQDRKGRDAFIPPSALREESTRNTQLPSTSTSDNSADFRCEAPEHPIKNSNLDSFEAVMQAMDAELSRAKRDKELVKAKATPFVSPPKEIYRNKGKQKADDDDPGAALDAELCAGLQDSSDSEDQAEETPIDYTLMKNFLESFKSQQGLSGPVSNLIGRLGWQLPRDEN